MYNMIAWGEGEIGGTDLHRITIGQSDGNQGSSLHDKEVPHEITVKRANKKL